MNEKSLFTVGAVVVATALVLGNGCFSSHTEKTSEIHDQPIYMQGGAPAPVMETPGTAPREGSVWVQGHWEHESRGWLWVPGYWR